MRQWLYYKVGYEKIALDTAEVKKLFTIAGRKYKIAYYTIKNDTVAALVKKELQEHGKAFEDVYSATGSLEGIPQREVAWNSPEHEAIHSALFAETLKKGHVLGPLKIENNYHIVMKVLSWTEEVAMTDNQIQKRWREVSEKLTEQQAAAVFEQYVQNVMRGKKIEFNPLTFRKIVTIVGPYYLKSFAEKQSALQQQLWNQQDQENILTQMGNSLEAILDEPLFRIDGRVWTVRDFEREIKIHPLVFRQRRISKGDFAEQFKLAVVDMVRDRYLAEAAYKKGYDRIEPVQRNVEMWKDNLLFLYQLNARLKAVGKHANFSKDYFKIVEADLNPYVDSLQAKYGNQIEINTGAFEKIKLTNIDKEYTSARLVTKGKDDWTYGRFEISAKLPSGRGTWPAIWMLPTQWTYGNGSWPDNGEIDIMEHVGFDPGWVHGSVHTKLYYWQIGTQKTAKIRIPDAQSAFHVYALEWSAEKIEVYVDSTKYFTFMNEGKGWQAWPFDKQFHLLLNIAVGGAWGGAQGVDPSIFPQRMEVDYVRVYK